nr:S26 family signal peptidase [Halostagnicola kamekurae]
MEDHGNGADDLESGADDPGNGADESAHASDELENDTHDFESGGDGFEHGGDGFEHGGDGSESSGDGLEHGSDAAGNRGGEPERDDLESRRATADGFDGSDDRTVSRGGSSASSGSENARGESADGVTIEDDGLFRWFLKTDDGTVMMVRDVLTSVAIVAAIGLVLFAVSGIWPPLVAVESGSMHPNMQEGDLIFVVGEDRFVGENPVDGTGVVTLENGQESGYDKFGKAGDVVVFQPGGNERATPVIHRAHFWVEEGDNWVEQADPAIIGEDTTCSEVESCPADHAGFITKGDHNSGYDQQTGLGASSDEIVKPEWITGKASFRIPWLGNIRLLFDKYLFGAVGGTVAPQAVAGISAGAGSVAGAVTVAGKRWSDRN